MRYSLAAAIGLLFNYVPPPDDPAGGPSKVEDSRTGGGAPRRKKPGWDPQEAIRNGIREYGTLENFASRLLTENFAYRQRHKDDEKKIEELEDANTVPEGGLILTKDQRGAWEAYSALGKPEDIKAKLDAGEEAASKLAAKAEEETIASMASEVGWKPAVLQRIAKSEGLHLELREAEVTDDKGAKVKKMVPHARKADDKNAPLKLLTEYVSGDPILKEFLPALQGGGNGEGGGHGTAGLPFVRQPASSSGTGTLLKKKLGEINSKAEAGNVLAPPKKPAQGGGN